MKDAFHSDIPRSGGFAFEKSRHLTDGSLMAASAESYDGCRPGELDRSVREQLGEYIVPSIETGVLCLPTFFTESKGPHGLEGIGERQVLYAGILGTRGAH